MLDGPRPRGEMSIDEYMGRLHGCGYTVFKRREEYLMMQGPDGLVVGIPAPEPLTPAQRTEELTRFMARNMLN